MAQDAAETGGSLSDYHLGIDAQPRKIEAAFGHHLLPFLARFMNCRAAAMEPQGPLQMAVADLL